LAGGARAGGLGGTSAELWLAAEDGSRARRWAPGDRGDEGTCDLGGGMMLAP